MEPEGAAEAIQRTSFLFGHPRDGKHLTHSSQIDFHPPTIQVSPWSIWSDFWLAWRCR